MTDAPKNISVAVYNAEGQKVADRELPGAIFGIEVKKGLLHLAIIAQQTNARMTIAATKTRAEVRGGGKKPWKQKGTGRARHGSSRSPIWRGGGVVWGPRPEVNYSQKINRKVKQKAICMALSQKVKDGALVLVDSMPQTGKTKDAAVFFGHMPIQSTSKTKKPKIGFVSPLGAKETNRSMKNLPNVTIIPAHSLNVVDLLSCKSLVMPLESVMSLEKKLTA